MTRAKKFTCTSDATEVPLGKLMETIIEDVIKAKEMPYAEWVALSPNPFVPLAIPVSEDGQYLVTPVGVEAAHALTQRSWQLHENLRQTIDREAFTKLSFRAIGDTILDFSLQSPEITDDQKEQDLALSDDIYVALLENYNIRLQKLATKVKFDVDRHIPCHLFHFDQAVPAFAVGPVQFLPRTKWVDSFVKDPEVRDLIRQVENRELEIDKLTYQSTTSTASRLALDVLRTLRQYSWVATVRMEGHEFARSHLKASVVVGLAIDAIGLRFQVKDARRFTKAGKQHLFAEDRLATTLDGRILHGTSIQMPGIGGPPGALASKMVSEQVFLDAAGCILQHYVNGRRSGHALHLVERWANALYWVGEARREVSDFMAVVNYGCAADGLSGAGGKASDMTSFAEAALKPKNETAPDGRLTIGDAVHKVYREGRNKLAHGEIPGLLEDLAEPRAVGEALLSALFDVVTPVLAEILQNEPNLAELESKVAYRLLKAKLEANSASV